jgi:hypothetical protein
MVVLGIALVGFPAFAAGLPAFEDGVKIQAGGQPIDVEVGHLVPTVMDWNGDGKKDLVVGQFSGGKIQVYLNQGTDSAPVFKSGAFLKAGGTEISLPAG